MDKYLEIAKRGFSRNKDSFYDSPRIFTANQNLHAEFVFAREFEGGTELGNCIKNSGVRGLPEFEFLLKKSSGFSVDILFDVDFKYIKEKYGKMFLSFWNMQKFPEDFKGIVYPKPRETQKSEENMFFQEHQNKNFEESLRFAKLSQKVRELYKNFEGFSFPDESLGKTSDDDIQVLGIFPQENYSLRILDENFEKFREILKISDYFGILAEMVEKTFELRFWYGVYNVRF